MILATLCYIRKNGKFLMLHVKGKKDTNYNGKWNGVGGKLKRGESPDECAIREIKEETGLMATNPSLVGLLTFPKMSLSKNWYVFVYVVDEFSGEIHESKEGELSWFTKKEILKLKLWDGDYKFLPYVFKNKFFHGKFFYVDGELTKYSLSHNS